MGRSLQIIYKDNSGSPVPSKVIKSGTGFFTIGDIQQNGKTVEIQVKVDGDDDNGSFFVDVLTGWKNYKIVRIDGCIYVLLNVPKNLEPFEKYGMLMIKHKSSDITINVDLTQHKCEYSISYEYKEEDGNYYLFDKFPTKPQEKRVVITAEGGSKNWYVKEVLQYEKDEGAAYDSSQGNEYLGMAVPYDGVFKYYTNENELIVQSYGRIDLSKSGMDYYFVIRHKDINNSNKMFFDDITYEKKVRFSFNDDNTNINSYKDSVSDYIEPKGEAYENDEDKKEES